MSGDTSVVTCEDCEGVGYIPSDDHDPGYDCEFCSGAGKVQLPSLFQLFKEVRVLKNKVARLENVARSYKPIGG